MSKALVGESHPRAKLTCVQVSEIRELAARGVPYRRISACFGIGLSHVGRIVRYEQRTDINGVRALLSVSIR